MKTLDKHNQLVRSALETFKRQKHWAGVKCNSCGIEMYLADPNVTLTSDPPMQRVKCPACDSTGYKIG